MFAKRIMIRDLESQYNAEYIANVFWGKCIARVSSITLIPYIIDDKITNTAYVEIDSFCETEEGRNCAKAMTFCDGMMIGHATPNEDNIWVIEPNTHYPGELCVGNFTTKFAADFFESKEEKSQQVVEDEVVYCMSEEEAEKYADVIYIEKHIKKEMERLHNTHQADKKETYCMDEEEAEEFDRRYPIRDLDGVYYTLEGALNHLWVLNKDYDDEEDEAKRSHIEKEVNHFETQIQKYIVTKDIILDWTASCINVNTSNSTKESW
jgi:hypothetical protein